MHLHLVLIALVAPLLTLSLPQPVPQGETGAVLPRHAPGNLTHGLEGERHKEKHHGPPEDHLPERALIDRETSGNSTHEAGHHGGKKEVEKHHALVDHRKTGNLTGTRGGEYSSKYALKPLNSTGSILGGKYSSKYELKSVNSTTTSSVLDGEFHSKEEVQKSRNSTSGEHYGKGAHHHHEENPPQFEKRIEDRNGTAGGYTGGKEKFRPDGHFAGRPVHERPS